MQNLGELNTSGIETDTLLLGKHGQTKIKKAEANPLIRMSSPDKCMPFIVLPDESVIVDITANNPRTILKNMKTDIADSSLVGGGFIDLYHGNKLLVFRRIESAIFGKKWLIEDVTAQLQFELEVYYPGYKIIGG